MYMYIYIHIYIFKVHTHQCTTPKRKHTTLARTEDTNLYRAAWSTSTSNVGYAWEVPHIPDSPIGGLTNGKTTSSAFFSKSRMIQQTSFKKMNTPPLVAETSPRPLQGSICLTPPIIPSWYSDKIWCVLCIFLPQSSGYHDMIWYDMKWW